MPGLAFIDLEVGRVGCFSFLLAGVWYCFRFVACSSRTPVGLGGLPGLIFIDLEASQARMFQLPFWDFVVVPSQRFRWPE